MARLGQGWPPCSRAPFRRNPTRRLIATVLHPASRAPAVLRLQYQPDVLLLGKRDYCDAFDAGNPPDPQRCVNATGIGGTEIQPGESATCHVVFDVPTSAVAQVAKTDNLDVLNFGDDFSGDTPIGTFGVIRTYFPPITISTS